MSTMIGAQRRSRQRGVTVIGMILLAAVAVFILYLGLQIIPMLYQVKVITGTLQELAEQPGSNQVKLSEFRKSFLKQMQLEEIDGFNEKSLIRSMTIKRTSGKVRLLLMKHEARRKLFGNFEILYIYDKQFRLE